MKTKLKCNLSPPGTVIYAHVQDIPGVQHEFTQLLCAIQGLASTTPDQEANTDILTLMMGVRQEVSPIQMRLDCIPQITASDPNILNMTDTNVYDAYQRSKNLVVSLKDITQLYQLYWHYCKLTLVMLEIIEKPEESPIHIMETQGLEVETFLATPTASPVPSYPNPWVSSDNQHTIPRGRIDQPYDTIAATTTTTDNLINTSTLSHAIPSQPEPTNIPDPYANTGAKPKSTLPSGGRIFSVLDEIQLEHHTDSLDMDNEHTNTSASQVLRELLQTSDTSTYTSTNATTVLADHLNQFNLNERILLLYQPGTTCHPMCLSPGDHKQP